MTISTTTRWPHVALGIALVAATGGMQLVDVRHGILPGPWVVSMQAVWTVVATVVCLPAAWRRRHELSGPGRAAVISFALLGAWSLASACLAPRAVVRQGVVPRAHQVAAALTGLTTMTAAVCVVVAMGPRVRRWALPGAAATLLAGAVVDWPVQAAIHRSPRLASGMGGSAVLHVAVLLAAAVLLDSARRAPRGALRLTCTVGGVAGVVLTVATGSRAAVVELVVVAALAALRWGRSAGRRVALAAGGLAVLCAAMVVLVPSFHRLLSLGSPLRRETMHVGVSAWWSSPLRVLVGVGSGRLFPWYAFEAKQYPAPGSGEVITQWGRALSSAHSVYLAVASELGVVGLVALAVLVAALWWQVVVLVRGRAGHGELTTRVGSVPEWTTMVLAATTVAFALDTYLLKNFAVSTWWWVALTWVALARADVANPDGANPARLV